MVGDVLAGPGDRLLHVDDVSGEGAAWGQPLVDGHANPALAGEVGHQRQTLLGLVTASPATAVHLDQHPRLVQLHIAGKVGVHLASPPVRGGETTLAGNLYTRND